MGTKSKFFRVFVEGHTVSDGRKIEAAWIDQIAETFNVETYTPRINIEHISGYSPEPPFNGYGDVVAVRAQTDTITINGKAEQRRALYAQVDGNDQLVALADKNQKPYPSVELTDSYAGSGKIGMVGLAFTDKPASIATQALKFSRSAPGTVFSTPDEAAALVFETAPVDPTGLADAIKSGFAALGKMFRAGEDPKTTPDPKTPANDNEFDVEKFSAALGTQVAAAIKPIADAQTAMQAEFASLKGNLEKTEDKRDFNRAPATGGSGDDETDC